MALLSGELPGAEQVELDCAGDFGDARLTWLAGGEVAGELLDETPSGHHSARTLDVVALEGTLQCPASPSTLRTTLSDERRQALNLQMATSSAMPIRSGSVCDGW
jgi:hypothetical protein